MDVKLQVGDTYKNSDIHFFPASGTLPTVRFKSNNTNVATVDADGNVTAVGVGTVNIKMIGTEHKKSREDCKNRRAFPDRCSGR